MSTLPLKNVDKPIYCGRAMVCRDVADGVVVQNTMGRGRVIVYPQFDGTFKIYVLDADKPQVIIGEVEV